MLRGIVSKPVRANTEAYTIKESLSNGELVSETTIRQMLDTEIEKLKDKSGIIIDGYPRNLEQAKYFENRVSSNFRHKHYIYITYSIHLHHSTNNHRS